MIQTFYRDIHTLRDFRVEQQVSAGSRAPLTCPQTFLLVWRQVPQNGIDEIEILNKAYKLNVLLVPALRKLKLQRFVLFRFGSADSALRKSTSG